MNEIWRSIKDYEGLYEVSNWGRVRSLGKWCNGRNGSKCWRNGRIVRPRMNNKGYLQVDLCNDGVHKRCLVHRLVAEAFIPNPQGLPIINHKDENPLNNRVENLEWCTYSYNSEYSLAKVVYMYTQDDKLCGLWPSVAECGRHGFSISGICNCCNGRYKTHKGFKWSHEAPKPPKALPYSIA